MRCPSVSSLPLYKLRIVNDDDDDDDNDDDSCRLSLVAVAARRLVDNTFHRSVNATDLFENVARIADEEVVIQLGLFKSVRRFCSMVSNARN